MHDHGLAVRGTPHGRPRLFVDHRVLQGDGVFGGLEQRRALQPVNIVR